MGSGELRRACVAGQFYPATAAEIRRQIETFLAGETFRQRQCIGCMLPHAGYVYSGGVAARTLARCPVKPTVVMFGPNHTGLGTPCSMMAAGRWQTPMGEVAVNSALAEAMLAEAACFREDSLAHLREHSLEVQLPLLQFYRKDIDIVPVCFACDDLKTLQEAGRAAARAIKSLGKQQDVMLIASSDMTHYQPQETARKQDKLAIDRILALDGEGLFQTVHKHDITMCGYMPVVAMLACAGELGAARAELAEYATSGDVTKDMSEVVGYAGMIVY